MQALLIDGLNLVRRIFAAVPGEQGSKQHLEGVLTSCRLSMQRALNFHTPSHAICAFDSGGRSWRHELYSDYKLGRPPMPASLSDGLTEIEQGFAQLGVRSLRISGFEADDVLATLAVKIAGRDGDVTILTTDKAICQLLSDHIRVYDHFNKRYLDATYIHQKFNVRPDQLVCLFALMGDKSLNIPGVRTIGIRTAAKLVNDYGSLRSILDRVEEIPGKLNAVLESGREMAELSLQLVSLKTNIDIGVNLKQFRFSPAIMDDE